MDTTLGKTLPRPTHSPRAEIGRHVVSWIMAWALTALLMTPYIVLCLAFDGWLACQRAFALRRARPVMLRWNGFSR